ncbi:hypothetical protein HAX54_015341 [Datura stramonium]|uniref:Uncharacterized protein n=1 Tax=Datura stramonium TaxID=4076 RepID=A0ABS8TRR5_DATST|nr:hypothetical protein [Datura stramonium]
MERDQDMAQIKAQKVTKHLATINTHKVQIAKMQRDISRYNDFYPNYEEEIDSTDQHMDDFPALATRSGKTTIEIQALGTRFTIDENCPRPIEAVEHPKESFDLNTERRGAPIDRSKEVRDHQQTIAQRCMMHHWDNAWRGAPWHQPAQEVSRRTGNSSPWGARYGRRRRQSKHQRKNVVYK